MQIEATRGCRGLELAGWRLQFVRNRMFGKGPVASRTDTRGTCVCGERRASAAVGAIKLDVVR
jgi:hypothetical protein